MSVLSANCPDDTLPHGPLSIAPNQPSNVLRWGRQLPVRFQDCGPMKRTQPRRRPNKLLRADGGLPALVFESADRAFDKAPPSLTSFAHCAPVDRTRTRR